MIDGYQPTSGRILRALRGGRQATIPELAHELERSTCTIRSALYRLAAQERIERVGLRHTEGRGRPAYLYRRKTCLE